MGKACINCGDIICGEVHNSRKYCFNCSPSGSIRPNRSNLACNKCGKLNPKNGKVCYSCVHEEQWGKRADKIYKIVGTACWHCLYDKGMAGIPVLDFHHLDPSQKSFHVNKREGSTYQWDKVWAEMKKCVLLCARCHREVHAGLITEEEIRNVYSNKWREILSKV